MEGQLIILTMIFIVGFPLGLSMNYNGKWGKCFDGEIYPIDQEKQWFGTIAQSGSKPADIMPIGYACKDLKGNAYQPYQTILSCCGCIKLTCITTQVQSLLWKSFWNVSKEDTCCTDCHGKVYPVGSIISSESIKDKCSTTKTKQCVPQSQGNKSVAVISDKFEYKSCCHDGTGLHPLGNIALDPQTCSSRQCSLPQGNLYATWISSVKQCPGSGCDCCTYEGKLVCNGGHVALPSAGNGGNGGNATCCDGELRVPLVPLLTSMTTTTTAITVTTTATTTTTTSTTATTSTTTITATTTTTTITTTTTATSTTTTTICPDIILTVIVRDALNNHPIENATVVLNQFDLYEFPIYVFSGSNTTNSGGEASFPVVKNGRYMVNITIENYIEDNTELEVSCDDHDCLYHGGCHPTYAASLSPKSTNISLVLNWDENPRDLDIHVVQINTTSTPAKYCRTSHEMMSGCSGVSLDVDNTNGDHNGAETITFTREAQLPSFIYMVYVDNYSRDRVLNESNARLTIGSIKTPIDTSTYNKERYWLAACLKFSRSSYDWRPQNLLLFHSPSISGEGSNATLLHCPLVFGLEIENMATMTTSRNSRRMKHTKKKKPSSLK